MLEKIEAKLVGVAPLIMHNGRLADPLDPHTKMLKELTSKPAKAKTDEVLREIRRVEWLGGLYQNPDGLIAIPSDNVLAVIVQGARKSKLGKEATAGIFETEPFYALQYKGPRDPLALHELAGFVDYRGTKLNGRTRIMRTRPRFQEWSVEIQVMVNTEIIDVEAVVQALTIAGERIGLGDFRPRFGRFTIETV